MEIISQKEAKLQGLKWYYTGDSCKYGHDDLRVVSSRRCKTCAYEANAKFRKTDRGKELKARSDAKHYEKSKDKVKASIKAYKQSNPLKVRHWTTMRKKYIKHATPSWADIDAIKAFYEACPDGYHVDHIIPLRGDTACGLHVVENLQYLTPEENLKKSNKC